MYEYIKGQLIELSPTEAVIECLGIGYKALISLQTYEVLEGKSDCLLYIHHNIKEDEQQFFGFATKEERELFRLLISVSGVGVGSARMMLSSLTDEEIRNAIIGEDVVRIKSVKGIGLKTAQRVIIELKDKIVKGAGVESNLSIGTSSAIATEATTALVMLGFTKANVSKVLPVILKEHPSAKIEDIIKIALQKL